MQLLNKSIRSYLFFSGMLILISIPFSYYFLNRLIAHEAGEVLAVKQKRLHKRLTTLPDAEAFLTFIKRREDLTITRLSSGATVKDHYYRIAEPDTLSGENIPYLAHTYGLFLWGATYQVTQRESLIEEKALVIFLLKEQLALLLILACLLLLIHYRLSRRALQPFYTTLHQLQKFELDKDTPLYLPPSEFKEFNDLNHTIQALAEKSTQTYQAQKEFTENAAHEIQTPLAVFQSKLEILMQRENLTQEDAELISSLTEVGNRLSRISKGLLLLTRIDNKQFIRKEAICLGEFTEMLISSFEDQIQENKLTMQYAASDTQVLTASKDLIDILFSNLLSNAIRYNKAGGEIRIWVADNRLTISNSGDSTPVAIDKMYERFAKNSKHTNSIGLGLAIVKKICDVCDYQLNYSYQPAGSTHTFTVILK